MKNEEKDIKKLLERFQILWDEALKSISLNVKYKNRDELNNLSRKIRDMKCNDEFQLSSLTTTELIYYRYALLLSDICK